MSQSHPTDPLAEPVWPATALFEPKNLRYRRDHRPSGFGLEQLTHPLLLNVQPVRDRDSEQFPVAKLQLLAAATRP
jgi:hypothetical protein